MKVQAQAYVNLSEVFDGFQSIAEVWHSHDPMNLADGTCNHSMITKGRFVASLPKSVLPIPEGFVRRLLMIPTGVMIDLEN